MHRPIFPTLDGFSLKSYWEGKHAWPVYAGNDATLGALGEYMYGLGAGAKMLVYLTISTGIGAGIVTGGQLLTGAYGMAGELGHICVDPHGPPCACGGQGCLGALASGTGIAENAVRRLRQGQPSALTDMAGGDLDRVTSEMVFQAASRNGHARFRGGPGCSFGPGLWVCDNSPLLQTLTASCWAAVCPRSGGG